MKEKFGAQISHTKVGKSSIGAQRENFAQFSNKLFCTTRRKSFVFEQIIWAKKSCSTFSKHKTKIKS